MAIKVDNRTYLVSPEGKVLTFAEKDVADALKYDYRIATDEDLDMEDRRLEAADQPIRAGLESAASAATFGASDLFIDEEDRRLREQENPIASTIGSVGGTVVPLLASGGLTAPAKVGAVAAGKLAAKQAVRHTPLGYAAGKAIKAGSIAEKALLKRGVSQGLARVGGLATEGGAFSGTQYLAETALGDEKFNAESLLGQVVLGGVVGAGAGAIGQGFKKAGGSDLSKKAKKWISDKADKIEVRLSNNKLQKLDDIKAVSAWRKKRPAVSDKKLLEDAAGIKSDALHVIDNFTLKNVNKDVVIKSLNRYVDNISSLDVASKKEAGKLVAAIKPTFERLSKDTTTIGDLVRVRDKVLDIVNSQKNPTAGVQGVAEKFYSIVEGKLDEVAKGVKSADPTHPLIAAINDFKATSAVVKFKNASEAAKQEVSYLVEQAVQKGSGKLTTWGVVAGSSMGGPVGAVIGGAAGAAAGAVAGKSITNIGKILEEKGLSGALKALRMADKVNLPNATKGIIDGNRATLLAVQASVKALKEEPEKGNIRYNEVLGKDAPAKIEQHRKAFNETVNNPEEFSRKMSNAIGGLERHAPKTAQALIGKTIEATTFLQSKIPTPPADIGALNIGKQWKPSASQVAKYSRYVAAVNDPLSVFKALDNNQLSREGVEVLRTLYPSIYIMAQTELITETEKIREEVPYKKRLQLSLLFDIPVDYFMRKDRLRQLGAVNKPEKTEKEQAKPTKLNIEPASTTVGSLENKER